MKMFKYANEALYDAINVKSKETNTQIKSQNDCVHDQT